jgi:serine/threonine protein kinase/Flp pilus assembly protein TadD
MKAVGIQPQQDDEIVMTLVELALAQPEDRRESYLETACSGNAELFAQAWSYVNWDARMKGFLLTPLYPVVEDDHPFEAGQLLDGRFRIQREVARGGMGIVYEAFDEKLRRRIALKSARSGFRKRLPPEVRHASEISHPNVCKIFEIHTASTEDGEVDFITMEFLEGETLAARLDRGPLPETEAGIIGRQLCAGLAEAHRNGVVHGDLKSSNVILTRDQSGELRAVITDFGLARAPRQSVDDSEFRGPGSSQAGGTPDYMAPELWKGQKPTPASDVYALGVILRKLTDGRRPDPHSSQPLRHGPIQRRCLEADLGRRFHDAIEVEAALVAARLRRTRRRAVAAIMTAAACLAAITAVVTYQRAGPSKEPVRLAMLPLQFDSQSGLAELSQQISHDAAEQLSRLQGGPRVRLTVIPASEVFRRHADSIEKAGTLLGATRIVWGTVARDNDKIVVRAFLTDTRTHTNAGDWKAEYPRSQVQYAAVAMAGMVTEAIHLPALAAVVKPSARQDYQTGLAYVHRNSTVDRALPLLQNAVAADPDSPLTWAALAEVQWAKYLLTKEPVWLDRTTESVRQAQTRNPDLAPVHLITGLLRFQAGFYEQAEGEYLRAIEIDPTNGDAYRRLGFVYESNHRLDQALAVFKKAVEVVPNDFKAYQDLGGYYSRYGDVREAIVPFEQFVRLAPDEPDAHRVLGTAYKDLGRYPEAERELRNAVTLGETRATLVNLANVLLHQRRDQDAIPFLQRAAEKSPEDSLCWMMLGTSYRCANLPRESRSAYLKGLEQAEKALVRDPRDSVVRARLAFLAARLGDHPRAEQQIAEALQSAPDSKVTRETAVWTYEALGQREEALAVLRVSPDDVLLHAARWPDLADLRHDPRFQELLLAHHVKE